MPLNRLSVSQSSSHLRPSTQEDEQGRIVTIVIDLVIRVPDYANARFEAVFTNEGRRKAETLAEQGRLHIGDNRILIDTIYEVDGEIACTIHELTAKGFPGNQEDVTEATYVLPGCAVRCGEELLPISGISSCVPFLKSAREIRISANGNAVLLVKDEKGTINKLITDVDIRKVAFGDDGPGRIHLYAGVPKGTSLNNSFDGLLAVGGFEVSAAHAGTEIRGVRVKSRVGGVCRVKSPWYPKEVEVLNSTNNQVIKHSMDADTIIFETQAGNTYALLTRPQ
jgi:hypothetical protein